VPARDLASVLEGLPGAACDFMKVDCEGCEFEVLLDTDPALLHRIRRISLEFHDGVTGRCGADIGRHLGSHGYRVRVSGNPVHRHLGQIYAERAELAPPEGLPRRSARVSGVPR
jgi:hypothetical protein